MANPSALPHASSVHSAVADDVMGPARANALSASVLFAYSLPRAGIGLVGVVVATYLAKFATDVLLIAPAAMAAIHAASRIWDGVTDPIVGYASDHTRARIGRRRAWMLASVLPLYASVVLLWAPPDSLWGLGVVFWVTLGYLLYEFAQTLFLIPHAALGVELTYDYHERTRLFGWQHVGLTFGTLGGLAVLHELTRTADPRGVAWVFALAAGAALAATILFAALRLPERAENQGRVSGSLTSSFADVFRNPHGRRLLYVYGIERLGGACVLALVPYVAQYILGDAGLFSGILLAYLMPQVVLTPLWMRVAGRSDKKRLWLASMSVTVIGFIAQAFSTDTTPHALIYGTAFVLGAAASVGAVCALSIKADVIDYDEYVTGERKEGSYIAVWNLVQKLGSALPPFVALTLMGHFGYTPNVPQNEATQWVMRSFFGVIPAICFVIGIGLFLGFAFNRDEQRRVRDAIDARRRAEGSL